MKRLTVFIVPVLIACSNDKPKENIIHAERFNTDTIEYQVDLEDQDTIAERNAPALLDLSRHQVFVDTTRDSKFYKELKNWMPSTERNKTVHSYLATINERFKPSKIDIKDFPKRFVGLRRLQGNFILYSPCDGIEGRYEIRDTAFVFHGRWESDAESFDKPLVLSGNKIGIQLHTLVEKSADRKSIIIIERIKKSVYKLSYKNQSGSWEEFVTPNDDIDQFDLVVNYSPNMKMMEYDGFD